MAVTIKDIQKYTARRLGQIQRTSNPATQKAALANLRRGIGHAPGELPQLWGEFLADMPEDMYGWNGQPSPAEWAVYTALTLFALHQQGRDPAREAMHQEAQPFGAAVGRLATDEDALKRIQRRLNAAMTANDVQALAQHLRGLVQLLRAEGIPLDYVSLAADIYHYQFPEAANQVRLKWGQDFYGTYHKNNPNDQNEEDEENEEN